MSSLHVLAPIESGTWIVQKCLYLKLLVIHTI